MNGCRPAAHEARHRRLRVLIAVPLAAALGAMLAGCPPGPAQLAGIEGTGAQAAAVATGTISGFGSIFVNGVEFTTAGATILVNGQSRAESALRAGQVVQVSGGINAAGTTGTATQVLLNVNAQGPVSTVDLGASSLTVLGQTILVGPNTSFGADTGGTPNLANLPVGALVEVSGFRAAGGAVKATRIDLKSGLSQYILSGNVQSVDPAPYRFVLNGENVDFSSAQLSGFPLGRSVQAGDLVQVTSAASPAQGIVKATVVALLGGLDGSVGEMAQITGVVTRLASAADFVVGDTRAAANASTTFLNGTAVDLALNASLEVQGKFDATGALVAAQIRFMQSNPLLLKGPVQAVDAASNSLTLLGVGVGTVRDTRFEDDLSANPAAPFKLGDIRVGDYVEVRGAAGAGNSVVAALLTRETPQDFLELRGVAVAAAPDLTILGVAAATSASTQFFASSGGPISASQFFAAAAGATVDLQGAVVGGVLQVQSARLSGAAELED